MNILKWVMLGVLLLLVPLFVATISYAWTRGKMQAIKDSIPSSKEVEDSNEEEK